MRRKRSVEKKEDTIKESTKRSKKLTKREVRIKRTTQNSIKYRAMQEDGTCVLPNDLYSRSVMFTDINYQIAPEDVQTAIFGRYMEMLNALGNEYDLQLTINNRLVDEDNYLDSVIMPMQNDHLDLYRQEMNKNVQSKVQKGNNKIISEKIMTYVVKEDNIIEARKSLDLLDQEFDAKLADLGSSAHHMTGMERLETIYSIFNPGERFHFSYRQLTPGMTTKDAISPSMLDFKENKAYFRIGERYAKVMWLKTWSTELSDRMIQFLSRLEYNMMISFHMKAYERGADISMIKNQIAKMEMQIGDENRKALSNGYDPEMLPMNLAYSYTEAKEQLYSVERQNHRLFDCQFMIMINTATLDELKEVEKAIKVVGKKLSCEFDSLLLQQEEGMNACLPLGLPLPGLGRTLTTNVCGILMPFTSQELMGGKRPLYYGMNQTTNNLILCNRSELDSPAGWILALPGSGKSFFAKKEMSSAYLAWKDVCIIVIDPQGEYGSLAKAMDGSVINVSSRTNTFFNPFELAGKLDTDYIRQKADFAQVMMVDIVGNGKLTAGQRSLIDQCVQQMYTRYTLQCEEHPELENPQPTLADLYEIMNEKEDPEAKEMAKAMWMFVKGSFDIFSKPSNVRVNTRFNVFDISDIGEALRPLGSKVILETLRDKIMQNWAKGIITYVYIDEIYLLLKNDYSENFIYEFYKWCRKFGAIPTGITQNVEDLLERQKTRAMLGNSQFIIMLSQAASDLESLSILLGLSNEQMRCVSNARRGWGLLKFGKTIIPFKDEFPKDTALYDLWNTDPDEIREKKANQATENHVSAPERDIRYQFVTVDELAESEGY